MRSDPRTRLTRILSSLISSLIATLTLVVALPGIASAASGFGDVDEDDYYADAVAWMVTEGITTGIEPGCFGPGGKVTRGQIAAFLFRLEDAMGNDPQAADHPFNDVEAEYQAGPVGWLYATGVTTGTGPGRFSPNASITRGDFAVMLWRYEGQPHPKSDHSFDDVTRPYQQRAVAWMAEHDITTGTSATTFDPDGLVTRAQAATFLHRFAGTPEPAFVPDEVDCARQMRIALIAGGLTPTEAACAAPHLAGWSVDYLLSIVYDQVDAAQDWDLLFTVALIAETCLTDERVAELTRLFL